jgi:hypothetical protein
MKEHPLVGLLSALWKSCKHSFGRPKQPIE